MTSLEHTALALEALKSHYKEKVTESLALLASVEEPFFVSVSGGKDSTVLWHLANRVKPKTPAAFFDSGGEHPSSLPFLKDLAARIDAPLHVFQPRINYLELLNLAYSGDAWITSEEIMAFIIDEPAQMAADALQTTAYAVGLRADESKGRRKDAQVHGPLYFRKDGQLRIAPLQKWTTRDIWAYIVSNDLPYHPGYDERFPGEKLEDMRIGVLTDLASSYAPASLSRLAYFQPSHYAKLKAAVPEAPWPV